MIRLDGVPAPEYPEKSILWWFQQLPDGYRERAIHANSVTAARSTDDYIRKRNEKICCNMAEAINYGIWWSAAPEPSSFWDRVYNAYMDCPDDPDLPDFPKGGR